MTWTDLPTLNAILNTLSFVFLLKGYSEIRQKRKTAHRKWMLSALLTSILFLISYVIYHAKVGSVPYPYHDWTRPIYFALLIPHIILAALMAPFVLYIVVRALQAKFTLHKKVARFVLPVWLLVSISGVLVYALLYLR